MPRLTRCCKCRHDGPLNRLNLCGRCAPAAPEPYDHGPRIYSRDYDPILTDDELAELHGMKEAS